MHEKVEGDWTRTRMRQWLPVDTAQQYKQNGDPSGVINSTAIQPVL